MWGVLPLQHSSYIFKYNGGKVMNIKLYGTPIEEIKKINHDHYLLFSKRKFYFIEASALSIDVDSLITEGVAFALRTMPRHTIGRRRELVCLVKTENGRRERWMLNGGITKKGSKLFVIEALI
jgi:hypothetical protein